MIIKFPCGTEIQSEDVVKITGYSHTCHRILTDYIGMVDTISIENDTFKTWPSDDYEKSSQNELTDREMYEGKIWFNISKITSITLIKRYNND